jgi:hypothetical protein
MANENRNDLTALEAALSGLAPAPARGNRDGLMYSAGRAAGARPWKLAACALAGVTLALAVFGAVRPPQVVDRPVYVEASLPVPTPAEASSPIVPIVRAEPPADEPAESPAADFRRNVLRWGPDALPSVFGSPTAVAAPPPRPLEQDLNLPPGSLNGVEPRRSFASPAPW